MTSSPPSAFFKDRQVVILASIDWDAAWQRHQVLASRFAKAGARVFFVENSGFRDFRLTDAPRILRKIARLLPGRKSVRRVHPVPPGVVVITPALLPPTNPRFRLVNRKILIPRLLQTLKKKGLKRSPLAVAYIPSETTLEQLALLSPELTVYDIVDNYADHPDRLSDFLEIEERLIRASDVLFTTSPFLQKLHEKRHSRVHRIHHGVGEKFFLPPRARPRRHVKLCYFGTLRRDIDYRALNALARAGFEVHLIGPEKEPPPPLHPAIRRKGMVPTGELVSLLTGFDAILLPYTDSKWNRGITPAKIYECLATGLPVVASDMPGLAPLKDLVRLAEDARDFVRAVRGLDSGENAETVRLRVEEAARHSEERQFEKMLRIIISIIQARES